MQVKHSSTEKHLKICPPEAGETVSQGSVFCLSMSLIPGLSVEKMGWAAWIYSPRTGELETEEALANQSSQIHGSKFSEKHSRE